MKYVNLIIDNKSDNTDILYTYGCEFDNVDVGDKVYVPFNRGNKIKSAYVFEVRDKIDKEIENLKFVESIDKDVSLTAEIMNTCKWMKNRYFCRYIDCVKLFLPVGDKAKRREKKEPLKEFEGEEQSIQTLTFDQKTVMQKLDEGINSDKQSLYLLQGVTGSGKTEIYMQSVAKVIENGYNAIVLVPEVSLTNQLIDRFVNRFGASNICMMHSKLSKGERYDQWQKIRGGKCKIVIGTRSGVFAPIDNIGLIVLDEEHDASYKSDKSPKYETVEVAIKRTQEKGGIVLMGSATPSITSIKRCQEGIYQKLLLKERYNSVELPDVTVVDMRQELKDGNRNVFSKLLFDEIKRCIDKKQQVILLINRRGYSSFVSCRSCGYIKECTKCNISMTYYKNSNELKCNYCGETADMLEICPECGSGYIKQFGVGTERVLEEVEKLFPSMVSKKLDLDETKQKGQIKKVLDDFGKGKIDILVGTQMVSKGLDYKNVNLVGIIAIDATLNIPDYRASERAFQLITQAAGRAGRGDTRGNVVVQTYNPENFAIKSGANQDIEAFSKKELKIREIMNYPPFGNFAQIAISGKEKTDVEEVAHYWIKEIDTNFGKNNIIGLRKLKRKKDIEDYRYMILLKYNNEEHKRFAIMTRNLKEKLRQERRKSSSIIDVNPYKMWRN